MKKLFSLLGALLVFSFANAQEVYKVKPGHILPNYKSNPEIYRYYKSPKFKGPLLKIPLDSTFQFYDETAFQPKAKFLYETDKGSVYALPLDNMPCLKPTFNADMPVAKLSPNGYIPNAINVQPKMNGKINKIQVSPLKK